jgi:hypothetical protein
MGSSCETIQETIEWLNANRGMKIGLVKYLFTVLLMWKTFSGIPKSVSELLF